MCQLFFLGNPWNLMFKASFPTNAAGRPWAAPLRPRRRPYHKPRPCVKIRRRNLQRMKSFLGSKKTGETCEKNKLFLPSWKWKMGVFSKFPFILGVSFSLLWLWEKRETPFMICWCNCGKAYPTCRSSSDMISAMLYIDFFSKGLV